MWQKTAFFGQNVFIMLIKFYDHKNNEISAAKILFENTLMK